MAYEGGVIARRARRIVCSLLAVLCLSTACSKETQAPEVLPVATVLSPVPAPAGLVAELVVGNPETFWSKLRIGVGGGSMFLPNGFGALTCSLFGLPITVAGEIDGGVPVVGVVADDSATHTGQGVLAIHVKDGARFVDQLTLGQGAHFVAKAEETTGIRLLTVTQGTTPRAMGVLGNYLLVAKDEASLLALGPYAARTLSTRSAPSEDLVVDVPEAAIAGPLSERVTSAAKKFEQQPSSVKQGNVGLVLGLVGGAEGVTGALGRVERARLAVSITNEATEVRATFFPKKGQDLGSTLAFGDASPLLALPREAMLGLLVRSAEGGEAKDNGANALAALIASRREGVDREALAKVFSEAAIEPPKTLSIGVAMSTTGPMVFARGPLSDAKETEKKLAGLGKLVGSKDVKALVKDEGFGVAYAKTVLENLPGTVHRLRINKQADPTKPGQKQDESLPTTVDVLLEVRNDTLEAATGLDAREALRLVRLAEGPSSLGGDELMRGAVERAGKSVAMAALIDGAAVLARVRGSNAGPERTPLMLTLGRDGEGADKPLVLRLEMPSSALREIGGLLR